MQKHLAIQLATYAYPGVPLTGSEWRSRAQCSNDKITLDQMFAANESVQRQALPVCRGCPVVVDCLAYALQLPEPVHGVWGGTTKWDRTRMVGKALRGQCRNCAARLDDGGKLCTRCRARAMNRAVTSS